VSENIGLTAVGAVAFGFAFIAHVFPPPIAWFVFVFSVLVGGSILAMTFHESSEAKSA